jgi:integrase/recombinase XerD
MRAPRVSIHLRVTRPDGRRPYLKPAYANRRLKPLYALIDEKPEHFPSGVYYLRYTVPGEKPTWEMIGQDAELVPDKLQKRKHALEGVALGQPVAVSTLRPERTPSLIPIAKPVILAGKQLLDEVAAKYILEKNENKKKKTGSAYSLHVTQFQDVCKKRNKRTLQEIDREDVLAFMKFLREERKNGPRTIYNKVMNVFIFLHHFDLPSLLTRRKGDMPKFTKKKVRKYHDSVIDRMFAVATLDESDLLSFFMETGVREQECEYACWPDVDFEGKAYSIQEHLDLGFTPKDSEEGTIPMSDSLVDILRARRKRYPVGRLIFPGLNGKPDGHLLRIIKELGLRAGVNCGYCTNKAGLSCATHPVCFDIILHKLRKTYASKLSREGVPVRTIQRWLRHSDLETTLAYLADEDDEELIEMVNQAFPSRPLQNQL